MKIAVIISNTNDPKTGTAAVSINLAKKMTALGHLCRLMFREDIFKKRQGVLPQILFAFLLPAYTSLWSYDVLDINAGDGLFAALLLKWFKPSSRPLLVARSHGLEHIVRDASLAEAKAGKLYLSWKYPLYHGGYRPWQVQKYLQQADLVFLLSQKEKDYAIAKLGLSPGRIRIVDNGLPDHFIGRPVDFDRHSGLKLAVIGTFSNRKGTSYVVPSLIHLMDRYEELLVGFFGTNSSDEAVLRHFPQHLLSRIKITAYYDHVSLPDLLQDYKILLMASLAEGYGMVGLEGMASGLALIATEVSGMAERLDNNVNAILIAPGSVPAIEEAVTRFVENPAFLGSIRRAAYAFAQNFSWNKVAEKTVGFYQAAIETRAGETGRQ